MSNVMDYLSWRGDLSFSKDKINDIDNLILSEISYIDFKGIVSDYPSTSTISLKDASSMVFASNKKISLGVIVPKTIPDLLKKASKVHRFKNIGVSNYINVVDNLKAIQFSAITFVIDSKTIVVAFRGTDDSLIGWQENLDLVSKFPVPAQVAAKEYLDKIASMYQNKNIIVCGHSKGGILAFYASIYCDESIKDRIVKVYSFDGPGLIKEKVDESKYSTISNKMVSITPVSSVVGMLFDNMSKDKIVVKSSARGIFQHDAMSWQIEGCGFIIEKENNKNSIGLSNSISNMLSSLSDGQRKNLANNVYDFMLNLNKNTLTEVKSDPIKALANLPRIHFKNRKLFVELLSYFIKYKQL